MSYFNAKIKVGEVDKYKRREVIIDKFIKQLPLNNDTYYVEHDKTTDSFRVRKDNKIKIQDDSDNDLKFLKTTPSHPRDRLARKVRRSKCLGNKKAEVRETETRPVIMPTGALLAAGKIKRKYAKNRKRNKIKKLLKQNLTETRTY